MIKAEFETQKGNPVGVKVWGHANFADYGNDVVCAGVTSAVQLVANGITHILNEKATVTVEENLVAISLPNNPLPQAVDFLKALRLHLENLAEDYPKNIKILTTEV